MTISAWSPEVPLGTEQGLSEETGTKDTSPPPHTPLQGPCKHTPQAPMTARVPLPGLGRDLLTH